MEQKMKKGEQALVGRFSLIGIHLHNGTKYPSLCPFHCTSFFILTFYQSNYKVTLSQDNHTHQNFLFTLENIVV